MAYYNYLPTLLTSSIKENYFTILINLYKEVSI